VIGVAATDPNDGDASFSNQGGYVDLAAPGVAVRSTLPGNQYAYYQGTSMAAPHVAAAAALLRAAAGHLTPDQVQEALAATAVDLGAKGKDTTFGSGRIVPVAALTRVLTAMTSLVTPTVTVAAPAGTVDHGTVVTTSFTVRGGGALWARKPVSVCVAELPSTAYRCTGTTTSPSGAVRHTRTATGSYAVKVLVTATSGSRAATSQVYPVQVRAVAKVRKSAARTVRATVAGAAGQTVTVQRWTGTGWVPASTYRATATRSVTGLTPGAVYRLSVAAGPGIGGTVSGTVRM
jgi:hypothetical protein